MTSAGRPRSLLVRLVGRLRGRHLLVIDLVGVSLAGYLALSMASDALLGPQQVAGFIPILATVVLVRLVVNGRRGLYSRGWRFASVPDLTRIAVTVIAASAIAFTIVAIGSLAVGTTWDRVIPRSFWIIELLLSVAVIGGVRFGIRAASEWAPDAHPTAHAEPSADAVLRGRTNRGHDGAIRHPQAGGRRRAGRLHR